MAVVAGLVACASAPSKPPPGPSEVEIRAFAAKGYAAVAVDQAVVHTRLQRWMLQGESMQVALGMPVLAAPVPVVMYLPSLGETSEAGERWRDGWAQAGYAVMSVQLSDPMNDESPALVKKAYSAESMGHRLLRLMAVVREAQHRAALGESDWVQLDWSRVAVAGFDLGAYTALALAGENIPGLEAVRTSMAAAEPAPFKLRAAIALSPYASLFAGSFEHQRFAAIQVPVLSVSSDTDTDPLGLVEGISLRRLPFDHLGGTEHQWLNFKSLPHPWLSGTAANAKVMPLAAQGREVSDHAGSIESPGKQRRRISSGHERGRRETGEDRVDRSSVSSEGALTLRLTAAQGITTAFLDAHVKGDALAREWLATDAPHWLGGLGELRHK
ncbi:hypothetical protein [Leptothrix ochracea]|uniref:hypothetical protein n=1 Tax=Leptothrix ochracea TaxID=735331 RepID=UPI0034E19A54